MGQRANILSQRLDLNLLWRHKNSLIFFKKNFWYKLLFDFIILEFLKKYGVGLINFNFSFDNSKFILDIFFYNYASDVLFLKKKKDKKKSGLRSSFVYFFNFYQKSNITNIPVLGYGVTSFLSKKAVYLVKSNFFFNYSFFYFNQNKLKTNNVTVYNFFNFLSESFNCFYLKNTLNIFFNKRNISNNSFIYYYFKNIKFKNNILLNKPNLVFFGGHYSGLLKSITFFLKKRSGQVYKKSVVRILLQIYLKKMFNKNIFLNFYNSKFFLNKYNSCEASFNILNLIVRRRNVFISYREGPFYKAFVRILTICLRFKQIGLFSDLISTKLVSAQRNQWSFIRLMRRFLYFVKLDTINFLGVHILLSGKFQRRRRKKRVNILKWCKPSAQVFDLNVCYSYRQSVSIYGVLGVKLWFYY